MNREYIEKNIQSVLREVTVLKSGLEVLTSINIENDKIYENSILDCSLLSEKIACDLRQLIYISTLSEKSHNSNIAVEHGINIEYENEILKIRMPVLLPKKKRQSNNFLLGPLETEVKQFLKGNEIKLFDNCVICFIHSYKDRSRIMRDYDNIELKKILDFLCVYVMIDDSGYYCDMYNSSIVGDDDYTQIYIMSKENFNNFILNL